MPYLFGAVLSLIVAAVTKKNWEHSAKGFKPNAQKKKTA